MQVYLGGPGSGSPVHWHNDAVNYAVHGSKLWTMLPPPHAVYTRRHAVRLPSTCVPQFTV